MNARRRRIAKRRRRARRDRERLGMALAQLDDIYDDFAAYYEDEAEDDYGLFFITFEPLVEA